MDIIIDPLHRVEIILTEVATTAASVALEIEEMIIIKVKGTIILKDVPLLEDTILLLVETALLEKIIVLHLLLLRDRHLLVMKGTYPHVIDHYHLIKTSPLVEVPPLDVTIQIEEVLSKIDTWNETDTQNVTIKIDTRNVTVKIDTQNKSVKIDTRNETVKIDTRNETDLLEIEMLDLMVEIDMIWIEDDMMIALLHLEEGIIEMIEGNEII